jgi:hypothetical protein
MKSIIEFPEEVVAPSSSSDLPQNSCQNYFGAIGVNHSDSETFRSTSSTSTESESDCDENDLVYLDSVVDSEENVAIHDKSSNRKESRRQRRSVSFGPIHVRQYERIVGDHPETKVGVPLGIGWAYNVDEDHPDGISIERYEADKIRKGKLKMTSLTRKNMMLHVFGFTEEEIKQAEKRSEKLRKQKEKSEGTPQGTFKKLGKKIKKNGLSILKGMSQVGYLTNGAGLAAAVDHAF